MVAGRAIPASVSSIRRCPRAGSLAGFLLGIVCWLAMPLQAARVTASFSPASVHLGEDVQFSLTYADVPQSALQAPQIPTVDGLAFRYVGPSSQVQFVNGQVSQSVTLNYVVTAQREGTFTVPAFDAPVSGRTLRTEAATLQVLARGTPLPAEDGQGQWAYLTLDPQKPDVFVGERLPVEVSLYIIDGRDYVPAPLNSQGFVFGAIESGGQRQVAMNGRVYQVVRHLQNAFPTHAGELTLGPAEASVRIPRARRRSNNPFDNMFDPFGADLQSVNLQSDPRTVHVKPLPTEGRPADFSGAVGQYAMTVTASPTNVAVGEPIRLKIQITGEGLLDNVNVPVGKDWEGFTLYPPQSRIEITDKVRNAGLKTVEQDIVPQRTGVDQLPPVRFTYFDPETAAYRTLTQEAIPVLVRPAALAQMLLPLPAGGGGGGSETLVPQELVPLKESLGALATVGPPLVTQPWYQGLLLAPVIAWLGALSWRRRQDRLARDPRLARSLAFGRVRRQLLAELHRLADDGDTTAFFAQAFRVLQEQIGERLDLPAAAITEAVLEERLKPLGAPDSLLHELQELFHACNQVRYAPMAGRQDLAGIATRIEQVLEETRRLKT
ncbi:MAG: protein BatD [Verrucomicrobiales bacterium]|nr:protein BatD [Verrucomicrobiales bacterium]